MQRQHNHETKQKEQQQHETRREQGDRGDISSKTTKSITKLPEIKGARRRKYSHSWHAPNHASPQTIDKFQEPPTNSNHVTLICNYNRKNNEEKEPVIHLPDISQKRPNSPNMSEIRRRNLLQKNVRSVTFPPCEGGRRGCYSRPGEFMILPDILREGSAMVARSHAPVVIPVRARVETGGGGCSVGKVKLPKI